MDPEAASLPHDAAADNHHSKHHLQPPPLPPQQAASSSTPAAATSLPRRLASAGNGGSGSERPRSFLGFKLSRRSTFVSPASHPIPSVEVTTTSPGPSPLTSLPSLTSSSSALSSPSVDDATDRSSVHSADDYRRRSLALPLSDSPSGGTEPRPSSPASSLRSDPLDEDHDSAAQRLPPSPSMPASTPMRPVTDENPVPAPSASAAAAEAKKKPKPSIKSAIRLLSVVGAVSHKHHRAESAGSKRFQELQKIAKNAGGGGSTGSTAAASSGSSVSSPATDVNAEQHHVEDDEIISRRSESSEEAAPAAEPVSGGLRVQPSVDSMRTTDSSSPSVSGSSSTGRLGLIRRSPASDMDDVTDELQGRNGDFDLRHGEEPLPHPSLAKLRVRNRRSMNSLFTIDDRGSGPKPDDISEEEEDDDVQVGPNRAAPLGESEQEDRSDSSSDSARSVGLTLPMSSPSSPALRHLPPSTSASITSPVGTDSPRPSTELVIVVSGEEPATEKKDDKRSESPESDAASAVAEPIRAPASPVLSIGRMSISARLAATVNAALSSIPSPPVSASAADPQTVNHPSSPLRSASPANSFTSTNSMSRNRSSSSTLLTYTPSSAVSLTASAAATASTSTISPTGEVDPATKERLARAVRMSELSLAARLSRVVARHSVSTPNLGTPMARQPSATDASNSTSTIATAATSLGRLQTGHKSSFTAAARSPRTSMIGHPLTPTTPNAAVSKLEMLMGSLEQLERDDDSPASSPVDPPAELANPSDPVVPSSSSPVLSAREQPTATDAAAAAAEPELVDAEDLAAAAEVAMVRRALMAEDAEDARAAAEVELVRRALLADEGLGGVFEPTSSLATLVEGHLAIFEAAAGSSGSGGGGVVGKGAEVPVVSQAASVHG